MNDGLNKKEALKLLKDFIKSSEHYQDEASRLDSVVMNGGGSEDDIDEINKNIGRSDGFAAAAEKLRLALENK